MSNFKFWNPWLLFLMIPLIAGVIVGYFMMKKYKRHNIRNILSLALHIVLAVTISFAFADPQYLTVKSDTNLYIVADASASDRESISKINKAIEQVKKRAETDVPGTKVGVVAFGKNAVTLTELGEDFTDLSEVYKDEEFDYSASNIENALNYTVSLFSDDVIRRIVIISDGEETDDSAVEAMQTIIEEGIHLDAIDVDANYTEEVSITGITYNDKTFLNREESVKITVNSTKETNCTVNVYENDENVASQSAYLSGGVNMFSFSLDTTAAGTYTYRVEIVEQSGYPFYDTYSENNKRTFVVDVSDEFNILYLASESAGETSYNNFMSYGNFSSETTVEKYYISDKGGSSVPTTLDELIGYDEIVLCDVDMTKIRNYALFAQNLETAVSDYGKSVLTFDSTHTGDENNESLTIYNQMLPVQFQPDDTSAVVLVVDNSGSMSSGIDMAIRGAKEIVNKMAKTDSIAVVAFGSSTDVVVSMQTIRSETNRQDIIKAIEDKLDASGGGTVMRGGLQEAYNQISGVTAEYKNVITLTDGADSGSKNTVYELVTKMSFENISCSFINIGSSSTEEYMTTLAKLGNGKYYFIKNYSSLSDIMVKAAETEILNSTIEDSSGLSVQYRLKEDPSLNSTTDKGTVKGGLVDSLSDIYGINYSRVKSGANTVLTVQYIHTNKDNALSVIAIPLYAYWNYGKGRVSSFTTSLTSSWSTKFRGSDAGKKFLRNVITQSYPDKYTKSILNTEYSANGVTTTLKVTPNIYFADSKMTAVVKDPTTGETLEYSLSYDGESYSANISTPAIGQYETTITLSVKNEETGEYEVEDSLEMTVNFDYSKEFNFFDDNDNNLMYNLALQAGGTYSSVDNVKYEITDAEKSEASYKDTNIYILIGAMVLYLVDIFIRKSTFKMKKKKKPEASSSDSVIESNNIMSSTSLKQNMKTK